MTMPSSDDLPEIPLSDHSDASITIAAERETSNVAVGEDTGPEGQTDEAGLDDDSQFEGEAGDDGLPELPSTAFSPINFSITNRRIGDIFSSFNEGELDPTPAFQRGYVWDRIKASRLIESVLLHVPLPLVYTAETSDGREVLIDGQQRLKTFIGFLSGEFPKDKRPFRLGNLKILKHLNGKRFVDLSPDLKTALRRYGVSIIRIANSTHESVKFEIFERLNTGSVTLSAHELRNCIYRGAFNDLIKQLAMHPSFTRVLALKQQPQRMVDSEMILRFFAFNEKTYLNYGGKMKSFMNDFMNDNQDIAEDRQLEWRDKFLLACDNAFTVFGTRAYRRFRVGSIRNHSGAWESAINKALFDVIMFWFARYEKRQIVPIKDAIRERLIEMMSSDQDFIDSITLGTSDVSRVKLRFEKMKSALDGLVNVPASERRVFSLEEKAALYDQNPTCRFCGQRVESIDDADVDHQVRFAEGGSTSLTNAAIAHRYCNRAQKSRH